MRTRFGLKLMLLSDSEGVPGPCEKRRKRRDARLKEEHDGEENSVDGKRHLLILKRRGRKGRTETNLKFGEEWINEYS